MIFLLIIVVLLFCFCFCFCFVYVSYFRSTKTMKQKQAFITFHRSNSFTNIGVYNICRRYITTCFTYSLSISMNNRIAPQNSRSKDLISMESELKYLLSHSNLTPLQRKRFISLLECVFDLFLTKVTLAEPLKPDNKSEVALVDLPNVELFTKMQSLVSAMTVLIMNEDEENNSMTTTTTTHDLGGDYYNGTPYRKEQDKRFGNLGTTNTRSPFLMKKSPSFNPGALPAFRDHSQQYRNRNSYQHLSPRDQFEEFKVLNTPVPRTFSSNLRQSTHVDSAKSRQQPLQFDESREASYVQSPLGSPTLFKRDTSFSSSSSSSKRTDSARKRYSVRF